MTMRGGMPSGTVIGATNAVGAPGTRGAMGGMIPAQTGRPGDADEARTTLAGTADQTWEVESGVAPVIAPNDDRVEHDPGPGVIGRTR